MKSILKKYLVFIILLASSSAYSGKFDVSIWTIGKKRLLLSKDLEVVIEEFDELIHKTHREWKLRLVLKKKGGTVFKKYPIESGTVDSSTFYFVPIAKAKYLLDLNNDGKEEFAVVYGHGGNAPATSVTIFSVEDSQKLKVFKKAWYAMEGGRSVIWNKKNAPKKCLYTGEGVCEYL